MRLAFIGGGTMAEAIISGVLSRAVAVPADISVGEPLEERGRLLREKYGVFATGSNAEAAGRGDVVVLSVKPQNLPEVLAGFNGSLRQDQVVLSIVAGARTRPSCPSSLEPDCPP
jgi:pyrroline-5-carboxylate reductase